MSSTRSGRPLFSGDCGLHPGQVQEREPGPARDDTGHGFTPRDFLHAFTPLARIPLLDGRGEDYRSDDADDTGDDKRRLRPDLPRLLAPNPSRKTTAETTT